MKNLKKVLALALAFAMSLTLFAGAAFTDDASIGIDYKDDVNMLVQLGVVGGYQDGSFKPQGNITRAETTKLIYVLKYGSDDSGKLFSGTASVFSDVQNNANVSWAKGYINYCYNQGIVGGVGNGKFNPNGNVTVAELAKMLLVCLGADATKEGYGGPNWAANVVADAMELGVFDGWTGDPTQPATRELACKLMRNTIFAPMYLYNAITGIGSQINAMSETAEENETLGEKTMGLKHVEGLLVSNARYALEFDAEGKPFVDDYNKANPVALQITSQKDKSQIVYEIEKASNTDVVGNNAVLTIDVDLSDDAIGNKVDVYFKGDANKNGTYSKVELLGDVLVNADTVVYDVFSADIEIMPNGESTSKKEIKPYIAFTTEDGEEKRVEGRVDYALDANGDWAEINNGSVRVYNNTKYRGDIFAHRMIASNADISSNLEAPSFTRVAATAAIDPNTNKNVTSVASLGAFANMGKNYLAKYRFISVDGGETYSYIINLGDIDYTRVNTLTDSTIAVAGSTGAKEIGVEAEVIGEVAKGQNVIAYAKDGKLYVEPTTVVTGKATNFKDCTATIDGQIYVLDQGEYSEEIDEYFSTGSGMGSNNDSTQYTVYKNYILEIEAIAVTGAATDYAVILYSEYDEDTGVAKAKFAFADNTEGTYEISKIATRDDDNNKLLPKFGNNGMVGALVRVNVSNGMASLTANNVKDLYAKGANASFTFTDDNAPDGQKSYTFTANPNQDANAFVGRVNAKKFEYKKPIATWDATNGWAVGSATYSAAGNDNSIVFMVSGGAPTNSGSEGAAGTTYSALKAKAYKLSTIADGKEKPVYFKTAGESVAAGITDKYLGDAVVQVGSNGIKALVAGVMSVGKDAVAGIAEEDNLAYVLAAKQAYNTENNKWYMDLKLMTATGYVETRSIDEVNYNDQPYTGNKVGADVADIEPGSVVLFDTTAAEDGSETEWVSVITNNANKGKISEMIKNGKSNSFDAQSGWFAAQIAVVTDDMIGFFTNDHAQNNVSKDSWTDDAKFYTIEKDEYRFETIAIDDTTFIEDGDIETISYSDDFAAGAYNAIVIVEGGKIVRVFSLYNNI